MEGAESQIVSICDSLTRILDIGDVVKRAVGLFLQRRKEQLQEKMIADLKSGKLSSLHLYDEAWAGGATFRIAAAIRQGSRAKNIHLLARYYFGSGRTETRDYDDTVEDAAIIESLTDPELRVLAVLKHAFNAGQLLSPPRASALRNGSESLHFKDLDLVGLFTSHDNMQDAAMSLQRWALVRPVSAWGAAVFEPTTKLLDFLDRLDLEGMVFD